MNDQIPQNFTTFEQQNHNLLATLNGKHPQQWHICASNAAATTFGQRLL